MHENQIPQNFTLGLFSFSDWQNYTHENQIPQNFTLSLNILCILYAFAIDGNRLTQKKRNVGVLTHGRYDQAPIRT